MHRFLGNSDECWGCLPRQSQTDKTLAFIFGNLNVWWSSLRWWVLPWVCLSLQWSMHSHMSSFGMFSEERISSPPGLGSEVKCWTLRMSFRPSRASPLPYFHEWLTPPCFLEHFEGNQVFWREPPWSLKAPILSSVISGEMKSASLSYHSSRFWSVSGQFEASFLIESHLLTASLFCRHGN